MKELLKNKIYLDLILLSSIINVHVLLSKRNANEFTSGPEFYPFSWL